MLKEIIRDDLIGRNPDHTFTETVVGSMTLVEFKDSEGNLVARAKKMDAGEAYASIREDMGLSNEVEILTTAERDAITPNEGTLVINSTTGALSFYLRGSWR